jgi:hypothetical protein
MRLRRNAAVVAVLFVSACAATPPDNPVYSTRPVVELARWQVLDGERPVAVVRQLEIHDPQQPVMFYRVEDLAGRWLGHCSANGRFSRRVPFQAEEQDLGVWSLARGVTLLLEASAPVHLKPLAIDADARRGR